MKAAATLVVLWTVLFVAALLFVGGQIAPCPELRPVGRGDTDRRGGAA